MLNCALDLNFGVLVYQTRLNMAQGGGGTKTSDVPLCHKSSFCSLTETLTELFIIFGIRTVIHIPMAREMAR